MIELTGRGFAPVAAVLSFIADNSATEVDPGFGTSGVFGALAVPSWIDGAGHEEIETEDRRGVDGVNRLGGDWRAVDGGGPGPTARGPSELDLRLEEAVQERAARAFDLGIGRAVEGFREREIEKLQAKIGPLRLNAIC